MDGLMANEEAKAPTLDDIAAGLISDTPAPKTASKPKQPTPAREAAEAPDTPDDDRKPSSQSADADDVSEAYEADDSDDEAPEAEERDFFDDLFGDEDATEPETREAGDEIADADDPVIEVKVDGQKREVKLSELKKAYAGEGAIEARLQQAAEARKIAAKEAEQYVQHAQTLASRLQQVYDHYNTALFTPRVERPDPSMLQSDPIGYMQQQEAYRADQERLQAEQSQMQQVLQQASQIHQAQLGQKLKGEFEQLTTKLPKLKDRKVADAFKREIVKAAKVYGFDPAEVGSVVDHRLFLMAADAAAYRALKAKTSRSRRAPDTDEQTAPLPAKGRRPATQNGRKLKTKQRVMEQAKRTGSVDDVAAFLIL